MVKDRFTTNPLGMSVMPDFEKTGGLVPAIITDANTKEVLMMAYMNQESYKQTLELGETVFWSRSRQEIWHKGLTSGNRQKVVAIALDCDRDTILIEVIPKGPACHTGATSCFYTIVKDDRVEE